MAPAAEPFATAADLLAELPRIQLSDRRIERSAETDGAAAAQRLAVASTVIAGRSVHALPSRRPHP